MGKFTDIIAGIGGLIAVYGIVSLVLYFFDYNLEILMWIDDWGTSTGIIIRIVIVLLGAGLFAAGKLFSKR